MLACAVAGHGRGAAVRSRSALAQAAAEPLGARRRRSASRSMRRITSGSSIGPTRSTPNEVRPTQKPPTASCCCGGAAGARVRSGRQLVRPLGRPGRRATNGRSRTTASRSTTRATSGSAATTRNDSHILKFTQDGKFLMQFGTAGQEQRQQRHRELRPRREDLRRSEGQRGLHRRRLRQQARRRHRRATPASSSATGARTATSPTTRTSAHYNPDAPPVQQFRTPVHCAELSNDGLVYVCDRPNDRIQVFQPDGTFVKEVFVAKQHARRRLGVGHRVLEGPAAEVPLPRRRQEREGLHHAIARRWRS